MEKKIQIGEGENKLSISVSRARSIDILNDDGESISSVRSERLAEQEVFYLTPGRYTIVSDGKIDDVKIESEPLETQLEVASLVLSSDAKDFHVVDGIGEIPADGTSFTTITIQKVDANGGPLIRAKDKDELFLRTNAGVIKDAEGKKEIRSLKLKKGEGAFRLYSEDHKRVATVQVISAEVSLVDASISIEFY